MTAQDRIEMMKFFKELLKQYRDAPRSSSSDMSLYGFMDFLDRQLDVYELLANGPKKEEKDGDKKNS